MKLEINPIVKQDANGVANTENETAKNEAQSNVTQILKRGIEAAKTGSRNDARVLLLRVTEADAKNETAWLWLASISEYPEELLVFLQNVLAINPQNKRALDWTKQTKSLLAKNFVQRGITASQESQKDTARQCFLQAIGHDNQNEMAWLWLASIVESAEEKLSHLQKVLSINPNNESAISSLKMVKTQMASGLMRKANQAFVAGDRGRAKNLLEQLMKFDDSMEDAWILKAHLVDSFDEKVAHFSHVLALNPNNEVAQSGLMSVQSVMRSFAAETVTEEEVEHIEEVKTEEEHNQEVIFESTQNLTEETNINEEIIEEFQVQENTEFHEQIELASFTEPQTEVEEQYFVEEEVVAEYKEVVEEIVNNQEAAETLEMVSSLEEVENIAVEEAESVEITENTENTEENLIELTAETGEENHFTQPFEQIEPLELENSDEQITEEVQFVQEKQETVNEEVEAAKEEFQATPDEVIEETEISEPTIVEENKIDEIEVSEAENYVHEVVMQEEILDIKPVQRENSQVGVYSYSKFGGEEIVVTQKDSVEIYPEELVSVQEACEPEVETSPVEIFKEEVVDFQSKIEFNEVTEVLPEVAHAVVVVEQKVEENVYQEAQQFQVVEQIIETPKENTFDCPFCEFSNAVQAKSCGDCKSTLGMTGLDVFLNNFNVVSEKVFKAIQSMELDKSDGEFTDGDLATLGIAYLNVKDLKNAHENLKKSLYLNPLNVSLNSLVTEIALKLETAEKAEEISEIEPEVVKSESRTIMVVDDSPTVRKLISSKLERHGHTVVSAIDGMDALAKINEITPDLILLDITMPKLDGYQVCKLIRNNNATRGIPVVMISGKDGFFDKVRGKMAGSNGFISKPFGPEILMKTLETFAK